MDTASRWQAHQCSEPVSQMASLEKRKAKERLTYVTAFLSGKRARCLRERLEWRSEGKGNVRRGCPALFAGSDRMAMRCYQSRVGAIGSSLS